MTYHQRTSVSIIKLQLAKGGIGTTEGGWGGGVKFLECMKIAVPHP